MISPAFTQDWFSCNIENWTAWLSKYRNYPARFLEIGSFEGRSTVWLLENILIHPQSRIVCIDPYIGGDPSIDTDSALERFHQNTKPWRDKVTMLKGMSRNILPRLEERFDFVYIDGSHLSLDVYSDGMNAWPLVALGGMMIFDDYFFDIPGWEDWKKTCHGIEKALAELSGYTVIHKSHQVVLLKT